MRHRPLSLRAFDAAHMMIDATLVTGADAEGPIRAMLEDPRVPHVQAHYAAHGCYAARIERLGGRPTRLARAERQPLVCEPE